MAGPYVGTFYFTNGRQLSFYQAANVAVGTSLPVEVNGPAGTGSDTFFMVPKGEVWEVSDMTTANTADKSRLSALRAGQVQIMKENLPSGKYFPTDATRATTAGNIRPKLPLTFVSGIRYKFVESVQGAA